MKQYNYLYKSKFELLEFIQDYNIDKTENDVLIHIYAADGLDVVYEFLDVIQEKLYNPRIIGGSVQNIIYGNDILDHGTLITFSEFDGTRLQLYYDEVKEGDYVEKAYRLGCYMQSIGVRTMYTFCVCDLDNAYYFAKSLSSVITSVLAIGGCLGEEAFAIIGDRVIHSGIACVLVENKNYLVKSDAVFSAKSIDAESVITGTDGKAITEINYMPFRKWVSKSIKTALSDITDDVGSYFPLTIGNDKLNNSFTYKIDGNYGILPVSFHEGDIINISFMDTMYALISTKRIARVTEYSSVEQIVIYSTESKKKVMHNALEWEISPFSSKEKKAIGAVLEGVYAFNSAKLRIYLNNTVINSAAEKTTEKWPINRSVLDAMAKKHINELYKIELEDKELSKKLTITNKLFFLKYKKYVFDNDMYVNIEHIDPATGLRNQAKLLYNFEHYGGESIILLQIKSFDVLYAFYGVTIGEQLILELTKYLSEYTNKKGYKLYRINQSKFAITESYNSNLDEVAKDAKKLQEVLEERCFYIQGLDIYLDIIVCFVKEEKNLLEKANLTLEYMDERQEKFRVYNQYLNIEEMANENIMWIKRIRHAIKEERLVPFFQPIINNKTGLVDKYECLIRMIDESNNKIIYPNAFLNVAKKSNLYFQITRIVIQKSFQKFRCTDIQFSFNLTVEDILNDKMREYILEEIGNYPKPQNIIIELVESDEIENLSKVSEFFSHAKQYGVKIAIDDFGTGYSNLKYLIDLGADILKIDGSIIKEIAHNKTNQQVVKTIVNLAKFLELEVVAEFVETEEVFNVLTIMGVDYSQGYYFAKPDSMLIEKTTFATKIQ